MSAIASFIKLPKTALGGLREAAVPKKRLFGAPRDTYHDYLRQHGQEVAAYEWSGYVFGTLLPYLDEQQLELMKSEHDELATFLTVSRKATHVILTDAHRRAYLDKLAPESFSEQKLCDYYNTFNGSAESDVGKPMLDGIRALRQSLSTLDEGSVVLVSIG